MNVCIVTSIHPSYNARIWRYCTTLADSGVNVDLIAPWQIDPKRAHRGVEIHAFRLGTNRFSRLFVAHLSIVRLLTRVFRRADLIHFHDLDILPLMALISIVKPVVYDVHENYPLEMLDKHYLPACIRPGMAGLVRFGQYVFSRVIRNIVLVSPSQVNDFDDTSFNRIFVYNYASRSFGAITRSLDKCDRDSVVFTGMGYASNGIELLIYIAMEVVKRRPRTIFHVADQFVSKDLRDWFIQKRLEYGLIENVLLFERILPQELPSFLAQCSVAITPALNVPKQAAAIPTKLFEYMAVGLPVVGGPLPYQKKIISEYGIGLIAETEHPTEYAEKICILLDDVELNQSMSDSAVVSFRKHFCFESQAGLIIDFYSRILK